MTDKSDSAKFGQLLSQIAPPIILQIIDSINTEVDDRVRDDRGGEAKGV